MICRAIKTRAAPAHLQYLQASLSPGEKIEREVTIKTRWVFSFQEALVHFKYYFSESLRKAAQNFPCLMLLMWEMLCKYWSVHLDCLQPEHLLALLLAFTKLCSFTTIIIYDQRLTSCTIIWQVQTNVVLVQRLSTQHSSDKYQVWAARAQAVTDL